MIVVTAAGPSEPAIAASPLPMSDLTIKGVPIMARAIMTFRMMTVR
jgi:hypothetical protein